tara:strand:+ start:791 stop:1492 length:702 start_codon:yes stop_codon:yes gene_type:complete
MVNINTVYQTVLALANKEQRGYITPQEFNLFANQAQMSIFEQYFYDLNQFLRVPGNNTAYADMVDLLEEKISNFEQTNVAVGGGNFLPSNLYKLQQVQWADVANNRIYPVEYVDRKTFLQMAGVPLVKPTDKNLVYLRNKYAITVVGDGPKNENVTCNYISKPTTPNWTYVVVNKKALYNPNAEDHQHFDLHESEQTELVTRILALAGITLKDTNLFQIASSQTNSQIQQQKQ